MANYTVFRSDDMSGTHQTADVVNLRFYDGNGNPAQVENGVIAKLQGFETGSRDVYKAVAAKSTDDLNDCVVIGNPEVMYDERKHNLNEYVNEAGQVIRGYILRSRNLFSVTAPGFVGGTAPTTKGQALGIGTGGKLDASGTGFGTLADIETTGRYTWYCVCIGKTEA